MNKRSKTLLFLFVSLILVLALALPAFAAENAQSTGKGEAIENFMEQTGIYQLLKGNWKNLVMMLISFVLMYLAIVKKFEPLLLLPIAFGMLLTNLPGAEMYHSDLFTGGHVHWAEFSDTAGLIDYLYLGVKLGIYPCLIFLGIGAMTDFGPLIANPKSLILGAAAQIGISVPILWRAGFSARRKPARSPASEARTAPPPFSPLPF